jgi:hypothetical protein
MDEKLIGKTIKKVLISEDKERIHFVTNDGIFKYKTENDCCNVVWIEHIDNVPALFGKVIEVKDSNLDDWEIIEEDRWGYIEAGFWLIKTDKGHCRIEVRNDHNGFYSGWVVYYEHDDVYYEGKPIKFKELKESF